MGSRERALKEADKIQGEKEIRGQIQELAKLQMPDESWLKLGGLLKKVRNTKELFRMWGFTTFTDYCKEELQFGKTAASDMIRGREFIEEHYPDLLSVQTEIKLPAYNHIAILSRAKSKIGNSEFEEIKGKLFAGQLTRDRLREEIRKCNRLKPPVPPQRELEQQIKALEQKVAVLKGKIANLRKELTHCDVDEAIVIFPGVDGDSPEQIPVLAPA